MLNVFQFLFPSSNFLFWDGLILSLGKISAQPHTALCIQFLNRENNDKNNTFPLGKQICFTIVWGCAETLPKLDHGCAEERTKIEDII